MNLNYVTLASLPFSLCSCVPTDTQSSDATPQSEAQAIKRVFRQDQVFGRHRDEASRKIGVGQAALDYAEALRNMDYGNVPRDFRAAFLVHAQAWGDVGNEVRRNSVFDAVRGEMHAALDRIHAIPNQSSAKLRKRLDHMWDTWRDVEKTARHTGIEN